ncbi:ComF family protein [Paraglaciecola sp. 2405UD69-4]|uniref:ComF family protein n=1 Tax=Paraglaciecola sp. 2405UD69-4 TaxID=3391836 RepID=UPI0039C91082
MIIPFEQHCLICKQSSSHLICGYCKKDLVLFELANYDFNLMLNPKVKKGLAKVDFSNVVALSDYQWPLSKLVTGLKFSAYIPNAKALATLFNNHCLRDISTLPQLILPIPLHKNRYFKRKFNQSIELAKQINKLSHIPLNTSSLYRNKATQAQTKLSAAKRRQNLKHAFIVNPKSNLMQYQHIALFDDVITTGTTMNYAYNTLKAAYPHLKIDIWCICLTLAP